MEEPDRITDQVAPPAPFVAFDGTQFVTNITDPMFLAVLEAANGLRAAIHALPNTPSRMHALAHADAVPVYAARALREGA